jgi:hypothetical protein
MCFSAEASFAAGTVLLPAGAYCLYAAARKRPNSLPLAAVPVFFAVQQAAEGVVWLGLHHGDAGLTRAASLAFLFFALAFWPFWIALQAAVAEASTVRRRLLVGLAVLNTVWFWVLYFPLLTGPESLLRTEVVHHSIQYSYPDLAVYQFVPRPLLRVLYVLAVGAPLLVASGAWGRLPGLVLAASAVVSAVVFEYAFVSVWCFFAAVLSAYLCVVFRSLPARQGEAAKEAPAASEDTEREPAPSRAS